MRHPACRRVAFVAGTAASLIALAAGPAQAEPNYGFGIDAQLYRPALDNNGVFSLEGPRGLEQHQFALRLGTSFAQEPLKIDTLGAEGSAVEPVLDFMLAVNFGFAFGFTDRLTFGFEIPVNMQPLGAGYGEDGRYNPLADPSSSDFDPGTGFFSTRDDQNIEPAENVPGDLRVALKYLLGGGLGLQVVGWIPFGDEDVFAGSGGFTLEPKVIFGLGLGKKGRLVLNASARLRAGELAETRRVNENGNVMNDAMGNAVYFPKLFVGTEAVAGAGVVFDLSPRLSLGAEAYAFIPIIKASETDCPNGCRNGDFAGEVVVGAGFDLTADTRFTIGGGTSVVPDASRGASFRVLAGITWEPTTEGARVAARGDTDGDGISDGPDACPDEPEDEDSFQDDDGCPELDNDLDGILDAQDKCKDEPEDRDGFDDGDGCPEGDNDNDKVPDLTDRCPKEPEDTDGFDDDDGCPDEDNDGDGILDAKDQCLDEPETVNGYQDLDGCPDQGVQGGPKLTTAEIDLQGERIDFPGKTDRLTKSAEATLDDVAAIMKDRRNIRFRIEVGVEESGSKPKDKKNDLELTGRRAEAVRRYLLGKGVDVSQIDIAGLGSTRPLDAKDPRNQKNRRVQFIRLNQ